MQQIYLESCFRSGYRRLMNYISNIASMSDKDQAVIKHRLKIIEFYDEFGLRATKQAFNIGRSAIFDWKARLRASGGYLSSLAPLSRKPKHIRQSLVNPLIKDFILQYRTKHHGVEKPPLNSPWMPTLQRSILPLCQNQLSAE